jgi:hypothetical protein
MSPETPPDSQGFARRNEIDNIEYSDGLLIKTSPRSFLEVLDDRD